VLAIAWLSWSALDTPLRSVWHSLMQLQSEMVRGMARAVRAVRFEGSQAAPLLLLSAFAYGLLHALGPGHGKFVITSYALADDRTVRHAIAISFLAAAFQAITAVVLVTTLFEILRATSRDMRQAQLVLDMASGALIAVVGLVLLARSARKLLPASISARLPVLRSRNGTSPASGCDCGHAHLPAPSDLPSRWSWRQAVPLAFSVGIRPCTGAFLLLAFSRSQGMMWLGIVGTFVMALGTAIMISCLAVIAVRSRDMAARFAAVYDIRPARAGAAISTIAAGMIILLGLGLLMSAMRGSSPL
jgi:ABC-type nickel/cobalt efflux system permease component RcnA